MVTVMGLHTCAMLVSTNLHVLCRDKGELQEGVGDLGPRFFSAASFAGLAQHPQTSANFYSCDTWICILLVAFLIRKSIIFAFKNFGRKKVKSLITQG